jgi:iron complex outermembrane receptor protein
MTAVSHRAAFVARRGLVAAVSAALAATALAQEQPGTQVLEEVSVTATREARATRDVPQAISVVSEQKIEDARMMNVKDAIQGTPGVLIDSKNGGYDARLIVRGAGLKAPYGIREVMVLRDGVPMTDPDSFTRLDFIDTQDIARIEIAKGPGNLYSTGSAGGAIHIISHSVFDERADSLRLGAGNYGAENLHLRVGAKPTEGQALALTLSHRAQDNDWRTWNEFDTQQVGVKHGVQLGGNATLETELSYSEADLQLPGSMSTSQFKEFKDSGEQDGTQDAWKHSGRYSKIWFFNTKFEKEDGAVTWKPRLYYTQWTHYHPVTGLINETNEWVQTYGTDLEGHFRHTVAGRAATLVAGVTLRADVNDDSRKYKYRDVTLFDPPGPTPPRITATLSDAKGELASISSSQNTLYGVFAQESLRLGERWLVDIGARLDRSRFEIDENEIWKYDYATGNYVVGDGKSSIDKSYTLPAPKLGVSYRLTSTTSVFAIAAQAYQVPSESEISNNPDLDPARSTNYEIGLKGRAARWSYDLSVYVNPVEDEIIAVRQPDGENVYLNAGKTDKRGAELSASFKPVSSLDVGAAYAWSVYKYDEFTEPVRVGSVTTNVDRSGNYLPYIPKHQYGVFAAWRHGSGLRARLESNSWGSYYLDNANSEKYDGYSWVTNLMLGYERGAHLVAFNVDNVSDEHYAVEVKKDTSGKVSYYAASPRSYLLSYRYQF